MKKILIFGHKKPDTDSVVASIALSYLKNKLGFNTEPRILGEINNETKYILNYFNVPVPKYLNDVKLQIKDVNYSKGYEIDEKKSIFNCYNYIKNNKISTLPIINSKGEFLGATSMKDIARDLIENNSEILNTSYQNIIETLNGKAITSFDEEIEGTILIAGYKSTTFIENVKLDRNTILIVGDRHSIIEYAVKQGIKMIILTNGIQIKEEHLKIAKENNVNIISTDYNTFNVSQKISLCNYISAIEMDKNVTYVYENDELNDFIELANKTKFSNYPVLNKDNKCLGVIRLADASEKNKQKVILVDHNEYMQSVDGIDEAEILEIIDHHKISVSDTKIPINFRNMTVGSTSTIIYLLFKENNIEMPYEIAGILMGAILSDTLLFKSPTTTNLDKAIVNSLSEKTNIDYESFAYDMFKAGSNILDKTPEEIIYSDFKNFTINNKKIGIGQISTLNPEHILTNQNTYIELLNKISKDLNYDIVALFITDIMNNCSHCLYNESAKNILESCFSNNFYQGISLPGVISRKKQIIPTIMDVLEKEKA